MSIIRNFFASLLDWSILSGIISAVATMILAIVACRGLSAWKQQAHFRIKEEFIDELLDPVHDYINVIGNSVDMLKYIEMAIQSYSNNDKLDNSTFENYVKQRDKEDGQKLSEYLTQAILLNPKL